MLQGIAHCEAGFLTGREEALSKGTYFPSRLFFPSEKQPILTTFFGFHQIRTVKHEQ